MIICLLWIEFFVGHNVGFDYFMMQFLWKKCNSFDSFPFGRRTIDTMGIEFILDLAKDVKGANYSLNSLCKKYSVKNDSAHSASADTRAAKDLFIKQIDLIKQIK